MSRDQSDQAKKYLEAYSFIEFSSGQTIINILKLEGIMRMVYDSLFSEYNISEPKFFVLLLLSNKKEGIALSELGEMMLVSKANMTTLINRMEREELVIKVRNEKDKRSTMAVLTEKGISVFNDVKGLHKLFSEKMTQNLSEDERQMLNQLLRKLQRGIVEEF